MLWGEGGPATSMRTEKALQKIGERFLRAWQGVFLGRAPGCAGVLESLPETVVCYGGRGGAGPAECALGVWSLPRRDAYYLGEPTRDANLGLHGSPRVRWPTAK